MNKIAKTALVTGGTHKDIDAMGVLALNLKDKAPLIADELVIIHDYPNEVPKKIMQAFNSVMSTRFIKYNCPIPKWILYQNKNIRYFSPMVFCKIECFSLLKEYETVIWSDYDVLIRDDLSELAKLDSSNNEEQYCFVVNPDSILDRMFYPTVHRLLGKNNKKANELHNYDLNGECITTPLFVMQGISSKKVEEYVDFCYDIARKYMRYLYLPEQCLFTMLFQKYGINYSSIDRNIYVCHPKDADENTKILHAYGQPKFWNGLENEQWSAYYEQWKKLKDDFRED